MLNDNIFLSVRKALKSAIEAIGLMPANERAVKKSAYIKSFTVSDGAGSIDTGSNCADLYVWNPVITLYIHSGGNIEAMHESLSDFKLRIFDAIHDIVIPENVMDIGLPIEWEEVEIKDNTAVIRITLTAQSYRG